MSIDRALHHASCLAEGKKLILDEGIARGKAINLVTASSRTKLLLYTFILASVLLQKIAAPGSGGSFSSATLFYIVAIGYFFLTGRIALDVRGLIAFAIFFSVGAASLLLNSMYIENSIASFVLVMILQVGMMSSWKPETAEVPAVRIYADIAFGLALLGIAQFVLQFIIGQDGAFAFDNLLGDSYIVSGFNNLIPLSYGSQTLKSNGVFFAEPSIFSQFIAIAIVIEFCGQRRLTRLLVMLGALIVSFSGTGILVLVAFSIYLAISRGQIGLVLVLAALAFMVVIVGQSIQMDIFVRRLEEFSNPNSSGYARFLAPFDMIHLFSFDGVISTLFGKGPGSYKFYEASMPYGKLAVSDPTWAKIVLEYGTLGAVSYIYYLMVCLRKSEVFLAVPMLLMYIVTGGYLANGSMHMLLVSLLVWNRSVFRSRDQSNSHSDN